MSSIEELNLENNKKKYEENIKNLRSLAQNLGRIPRCFIRTFGCQQNISDSERIAGMMLECGYEITDLPNDADLIIFNTCAVREHAEDRVFGNVGELKRIKELNSDLIIAIGGCMVQQEHIAAKLKKSYPYVDVIFNTNKLDQLPYEILRHLESSKKITSSISDKYEIFETLPIIRDQKHRAYIPIMFGCDNFCTYCVVPLVRGRERSRASSEIIAEFKNAINDGYKDIMLLGQNVNSYGKGLDEEINFSKLLRKLNDIEGEFIIRFMTSHPRDATHELFDTIADCKKISKQIHLPVQSGNNRILSEMNRHYTKEDYLKLIEYAKSKIDGVSFTSDVIIGFPGETKEEYDDTVELIRKVGFHSVFTFIFSKREGTKAANLYDDTPHEIKAARLNEIVSLQEKTNQANEQKYVGKTVRALVISKIDEDTYEARLDNNSLVKINGECTLFNFYDIEITHAKRKKLFGRVIK